MNKYCVEVAGSTVQRYPAFSSTEEGFGHVVTLLFWERTGSFAHGEEILIDAGARHFFGLTEEECIEQMRRWIDEQWGPATTTISVEPGSSR